MEDLLSIEEYFKTMSRYTKILALAHYDRMIEWAKKQPQEYEPTTCDMYAVIHEDWNGNYCNYCIKYIACKNCPLGKYGTCCDRLWLDMSMCSTWGRWIKYAKKVRKYIKDNG